jgi:hypothetical protein
VAKCSECGFLTLRDRISGKLVEVIDDYRVSGKCPEFTNYDIHNYPICFVMAYDLMPEVENAAQKQFKDGSDDWSKYVVKVIQDDRSCPKKGGLYGFTKYYQGFTPKEHREMLDKQWQLDQEERRRISDRNWHITEAVILALVGAIIALVSAFISRGCN